MYACSGSVDSDKHLVTIEEPFNGFDGFGVIENGVDCRHGM